MNRPDILPGYPYCEYLLILNPHEALAHKINKVKAAFSKSYGIKMMYGTPKLIISRFSQTEMAEQRILSQLKMVAMAQPAFKVELKNFGSFPSHSIFIHVTSKQPIKQLVKSIRQIQRTLTPDKDHKPYFNEEPYFLIGSKLLPWQYEKGWLEYSNHQFTGRFIADTMLLLKRRTGDKRYQVVEYLKFENLPVAARQGELFV